MNWIEIMVWYCNLWNECMVMQLRIECMKMDACNCKLWYGCMVLKCKVLNECMVLKIKGWMIRKEYMKLKLRTWIKWMDCDSL